MTDRLQENRTAGTATASPHALLRGGPGTIDAGAGADRADKKALCTQRRNELHIYALAKRRAPIERRPALAQVEILGCTQAAVEVLLPTDRITGLACVGWIPTVLRARLRMAG